MSSSEPEKPLGFELMNNLTQRNLDKHNMQVRKGKTKPTLNKKIESAQKRRLNQNLDSESVETIESQKQLANESLEVGMLLGNVVADNEEAAFRRITRSLKKSQKAVARIDED